MPVFENREKMQLVLGELFTSMLDDPEVGPKFVKSNIIIRFNISKPDHSLWLTPGDGEKGEVLWGKTDLKPTIEMSLSGDSCHKFWLKQITMPIALAKGHIKAKGPMPKVLKLLPLLKPVYANYPEIASNNGLPV